MVDPHFAANQTAIAILLHKIDAIRAENEKLRAKCETIYDELLEAKGQVVRLRAALKPFAIDVDDYDFMDDQDEVGVAVGVLRAAAAALKETGE